MSKIKLDLKEFKHVSSDDKSTKLKHSHGHFLVLSHKSLSPDAQKQLAALAKVSIEHLENAKEAIQDSKESQVPEKMADGGGVNRVDEVQGNQVANVVRGGPAKKEEKPASEVAPAYNEEWPLPSQTSVGKALAEKKAKEQGMAQGGRVKMADGGEAEMERPSPPQLSLEQLNSQMANIPSTMPDIPNAQSPQLPSTMDLIKSAGTAAGQYLMSPPGSPVPEMKFEQPQVAMPQDPQMPVQMAQQPVQAEQPQGIPGTSNYEGLMKEGYQNKLAGINQAAKAEGSLGASQAEALNHDLEYRRHAEEEYTKKYNDLEAERQAHMKDIRDGHIDPEKYWENHSKIAAGIGMIIAGFGGGMTGHGGNAAVDYIKYQMNQNLEAQAKNLSSHYNMLNANLQQFGNLRDAVNMTRLMQSDVIQDELMKAAAIAKAPQAKAAALQAAGQLKMEFAPLQQQMAMRQAMVSMANTSSPQAVDHMLGYMRVMNPEMAKEMESRYVPGVGMASVPVPEKVRGDLVAHEKLQSIGQDLLNYSKTHTNLVPGTAEYNVGVQKAQILQQAIREGLLGTVFRESEKPLLEKFVDDNPAGAFKAISAQPKIRTILESNAMQLNLLKKNYGLKQSAMPQQMNQSPQAAIQWAKSNPKDPRAQEILKRLGK